MKLSDRMFMVASLVKPGKVLADIGCDHGYLSVWIVREGIAGRCIAMDLREGPLAQAEKNIRFFHQEERIETRLSDGMNKLAAGEADRIVIAGMGGILMADILERGRLCVAGAGQLVLQPQSDVALVRRKVHALGFRITDEKTCFEDGKYYVAFACEPGAEDEPYSDAEYIYGRILSGKRDEVHRAFLEKELAKNRRMLQELEKAETESSGQRIGSVRKRTEQLLLLLGLYD